jgi:hypothetical protein
MKSEEFNLITEPGCTGKNFRKDLWRYKELFYILVWRDVLVNKARRVCLEPLKAGSTYLKRNFVIKLLY